MEKLYDIPPGSSFPETDDGENLSKLYLALDDYLDPNIFTVTYRLRKNAEAKQRLESKENFNKGENDIGLFRRIRRATTCLGIEEKNGYSQATTS